MQGIPNVIRSEYFIFEASECLRKSQFIRCFKLLDPHMIEPESVKDNVEELQQQIQLGRRLLYCCNQLLKRYFRKISDKSHKLQPLIHRTIELSLFMQQYMSFFFNLAYVKKVKKPEPLSQCESPIVKRKQFFRKLSMEHLSLKSKLSQYSSYEGNFDVELKNEIWFKNQCINYYKLLILSLQNCFRYHKFLRTQNSQIFLHQAVRLSSHARYSGPVQQLIKSRLHLAIGNCYFEVQDLKKAEHHYQEAVDCAAVTVYKILDDIEKLKKNIDDPEIKQQMGKLMSHIQMSLEFQLYLSEQGENYHRSIETSGLIRFCNKFLGFFNVHKELQVRCDKLSSDAVENYQDHVKETVEICKLLSLIYDIPVSLPETTQLKVTKHYDQDDLLSYFQERTMDKLRETGLRNDCILIRQADLPPRCKLKSKGQHSDLSYFVRNSQKQRTFKLKQNSSTHSIEQSTNFADSQIMLSGKNEASLSKIDTSMRSQIRIAESSSKKKPNKDHRNSFLHDLIQLRNLCISNLKDRDEEGSELERAYNKQKNLLYKISNQNAYVPLDRVVSSYINENLNHHQKCASLDEIKQNATQIVQAENEVHKEVPITRSLLNARKITCSQGVLVKESEHEFNKLLEFNALEYFDFVTTQKDQALTQIKATQECRQVRLAQQNLFSENFVPKKKLGFLDVQEQQKQEAAKQLAVQAELLLNTASKGWKDKKPPLKRNSKPKLSIFNFQNDTGKKLSVKLERNVSLGEAVQTAQSTIKKQLQVNEKQRIQYEHEDEDLKEAELPFKFKRSRSSSNKKGTGGTSILSSQAEYTQLCLTTKFIREKSFGVVQDTKIKLWAQERNK